MLLQEQAVNVERSATFTETSFKIKASAKAFKILSSGLYSDKTKAILRELGTNAADAQVMAGKEDRKFLVHLPNFLEPWLTVRDYGTGLSAEDIEGIYTTYFDSDKTRNNNVTGCLGLGSKSPFSYTDNFSVVSYFNGKKLTYTAFMNEHGLPAVAKLGEEDTQEENGLEVMFPVDSRDFNAFIEKAHDVYRYFTVRPEITGATVKFDDVAPDYSGANWKLFRSDKGRTHQLVMGNVAYPLNLHEAGCKHNLFYTVSIEIHCSIGQAEMTASRESLEYTDLTKETIKKATDEAVACWTNLILQDFAAQPTYWDACLFYRENQLWIKRGTEWNGRPVKVEIDLTKFLPTHSICKPVYGSRIKYLTNQTLHEVEVNKDTVFLDDDLPKGTKLRAMQYVRNTDFKHTLLIFKFNSDGEKQAFADECGFPVSKIIKTSSLPKVIRQKNPNGGKKVVYQLNIEGHNNRTFWKTVQLNDVQSGVYVELDRWQVNGYHSASGLSSMVRVLRGAGYYFPVYGVRKNIIKKVDNNPNWTTLDAKIKEIQQEYAQDKEFILNAAEYMKYARLALFADKLTGIDIADFVSKVKYVEQNYERFQKVYRIMLRSSTQTDLESPALDALKHKYPLFFFIIEHVDSGEWPIQEVVDYINLVNKV
jgi:hypothetical protein